MATVNEVLKTARETLNMSQEEVATAIRKKTGEGFTRVALALIESGETKKPSAVNLQAACDVLKIDLRQALSGRLVWVDGKNGDDMPENDERKPLALPALDDPRKLALLALFESLPKKAQDAVLADLAKQKIHYDELWDELKETPRANQK